MAMEIGIRVDVDTRIGLLEGVPRLLELFDRYLMRVSFFVTFGPDRSGMAVMRLIRPSFAAKMWRTGAVRLYGLRTLLSGTLLRSLPVGEGAPEILKAIVARGHELGIHGYDHVRWQDRVERMQDREIEKELDRAVSAHERIFESRPISSAAPGWRCTPSSLAVQDGFRFLYASDVRGTSPFLPMHDGRCSETLQLPTTFPTLDELLGRHREINEHLVSLLREGLNIHTVHAEVEGRSSLPLFEQLLKELIRRNVKVVRLIDIAKVIHDGGLEHVSRLPVTRGKIPGRSGWVACQG
jgi:peptidoglycan/xylan/chitin deacetylase (PgdA/CDA1 family)